MHVLCVSIDESAVYPIAVSIHSAQIVLLKYHFPLKESREMAISRFEVGTMSRIYCYTRL